MKYLRKKIRTAIIVYSEFGIRGIFRLIRSKLHFLDKFTHEFTYQKYIKQEEKDILVTKKLEYNPLISVIVPVYNVEAKYLKDCIESVLNQTYTNWELCMADDASTMPCVKKTLEKYTDERIKIVYRKENGHISRASNSALELATGEFVAFLDCDDTLAPNALYEVAKKLNEDKGLDVIYTDEDKINAGNYRVSPFFKPDWASDTLMSIMYFCHLSVYRRSIVNKLGGLRVGYEGAQDYDLALRIVECTNRIGHIRKILYHWRMIESSTSQDMNSKPYAFDAQIKAKEAALERRGIKGSVEYDSDFSQCSVKYELTGSPLVSIIIPSKNNFTIFKKAIDSVIEKSLYKNYEIIAIDNGSDKQNTIEYTKYCKENNIEYIREVQNYNYSKLCNQAVKKSKGEILLFINDDVEVISPYWIERMAAHARLEHVGAVGAKLLYTDTTKIQHVGVASLKAGPDHVLKKLDDRIVHLYGFNKIVLNCVAVTGACLMVERKKYDEVEGFYENLPFDFNDVDFCYKLLECGYENVQRNDVVLYHYESFSRGEDYLDVNKDDNIYGALKILNKRHPAFDCFDPYYNYNNRLIVGGI